jgi:hypothetical protein
VFGAAAVTLAGASLYVVYAFDPAVGTFFPHCAFHDLTGLQCPGCGTTRALHAFLHGHIAAAFHYNRLLVSVAPLLVAAVAGEARSRLLSEPAPRVLRNPWTGWSIFVTLVLWWIVRNVMNW